MKRSLGQTNTPLFFTHPWGIHRCLVHLVLACPSGPGLVGFWFPNVRTIQPLGTHARMLAETALIADSLQLDTFVHSAWRTPVVLPSAFRRGRSLDETLDAGLCQLLWDVSLFVWN